MRYLFILLFLSSTCLAAEIQEDDHNPRYADLIGKTFLLKTELAIHDLSEQESFGSAQRRYVVSVLPGIGGREVKSQSILPVATTIRVNAVITCKLCFFLRLEELLITLVGDEQYQNARIELLDLYERDLMLYENEKVTLNPEFFELKE